MFFAWKKKFGITKPPEDARALPPSRSTPRKLSTKMDLLVMQCPTWLAFRSKMMQSQWSIKQTHGTKSWIYLQLCLTEKNCICCCCCPVPKTSAQGQHCGNRWDRSEDAHKNAQAKAIHAHLVSESAKSFEPGSESLNNLEISTESWRGHHLLHVRFHFKSCNCTALKFSMKAGFRSTGSVRKQMSKGPATCGKMEIVSMARRITNDDLQ